jgi:hypothetical protein
MALTIAEIKPGAVAYFDVAVLHADPEVSVTGDPVKRDVTGNQFVCYRVEQNKSYWSPLTATFKFKRTLIKAEWVSNGYGPLGAGKVWLQDGKNTYQGPNQSFMAATATEGPFEVARPTLSNEALTEIHLAIKGRGGAL